MRKQKQTRSESVGQDKEVDPRGAYFDEEIQENLDPRIPINAPRWAQPLEDPSQRLDPTLRISIFCGLLAARCASAFGEETRRSPRWQCSDSGASLPRHLWFRGRDRPARAAFHIAGRYHEEPKYPFRRVCCSARVKRPDEIDRGP